MDLNFSVFYRMIINVRIKYLFSGFIFFEKEVEGREH